MEEFNPINDKPENNLENTTVGDNSAAPAPAQEESAPQREDIISTAPASDSAPASASNYSGQYYSGGNTYSSPYGGYNTPQYNNPYTTYNQSNRTYGGAGSASYTFSNDPSYGAEEKTTVNKPKKKNSALKVIALILCCVLVSGAAGLGTAYIAYKQFSDNNGAPTQNNNNTNIPNDTTNDSTSVGDEERAPIVVEKNEGSSTQYTTMTEVIENVRDTVVEIVTENITESQFYGQYVTSGAGSGVIINPNGYIITNNHVVDGANKIFVRTTDNKEYNAKLIGKDSESDVAIIKIEATDLAAATLGDSSAIKLGEQVIAIGNPLGSLGGTVTDGIISALDREVTIDGQEMVLLQTNAAVNPGNSGGGLFNMAGELIGIVNAKSSSSSSSGTTIEGLGFAIPINHAFDVATQLIEYGYVRGKVSLTITVYAYERDMTYKQGFTYYTIKAGVYVEDCGKNTELQKNDRFVTIDGTQISNMTDIKDVLARHKVGDTIKAKVIRTVNNTESEIEITLTCYELVPSDIN